MVSTYVIASEAVDLSEPAIVYAAQAGGGSYLAAYITSSNEIKMKRLGNGGKVLSDFTAVSGTGVRHAPSLAYNSVQNQFLLVWEEIASGISNIYGQVFSPDGQAVSAKLSLGLGSDTSSCVHPSAAFSSGGDNYLVVWQVNSGSSLTGDIVGDVLSSTGQVLKDNFIVRQMANNQKFGQPVAAYNSQSNEWLVVFQLEDSTLPSPHKWNILGHRLSSDGTILDLPSGIYFAFSPTNLSVEELATPSIASFPDASNSHCWVVIWTRRFGPYPPNRDIYQNILKCDGTPQFSDGVGLVVDPENDDYNPSVAASEGGQRFLVTWMRAAETDLSSKRINGLEEDLPGGLIGPIQTLGDVQSQNPVVAAGPKSDFLVIFENTVAPAKTQILGSLLGFRILMPVIVK